MSVVSVARKDLKNVRRSWPLWAGGIFLAIIATLLAYANQGFGLTGREAVQQTFSILTVVLGLLLPIVALVVSYLAIAGEREGGGIKFLLSLPNRRRDVYAGKLLSRLTVAAAGLGFVYLAATSVSLAKHGAFPPVVVFGTLLVTLAYGSLFVTVGLALSASVATQGQAIARSLVAYFVLVLLYIFPVLRISSAVEAFHTRVLGMDANPDLYNAIEYTSPYRAYQKATNLVVPTEFEQRPFMDSAADAGAGAGPGGAPEAVMLPPDLPVYLTDEVAVLIIAVWIVVPLYAGYRLFEGAELE